ncbi:hypothetical protein GYMLUDRAFT_38307 [Collybiopsis luxurians FD-317 M1]|nr:hypothetical protein GYMLUDRAFT_38307 [Collybiopsis luxurians FD-317 M1]
MLLLVLASWFVLLTVGQSIQPPAIPLAVRSPYLQAYFPFTSTTTPANGSHSYPNFWTTNHTLSWSGFLRVDNVFYEWIGGPIPNIKPSNNATVTPPIFDSYQVTPTRSILSMTAGTMAINVTFLSPIEPGDLVLQSFPFTYVYFEASSLDGDSHSLQVYYDITGEILSSNPVNVIQWNTTTINSVIYHEAQRFPFQYMTELSDIAEDGVAYLATNAGIGVTYQTGLTGLIRTAFLNNGKLNNTQNTEYNASDVAMGLQPAFAFSTDLGNITSTSSPVVWGIGLVRNPDIIYTTAAGNQTRQPYFFTKYSNVETALLDFMGDASNALERATALDNKIISDANDISSNYADLVSLASRQTMAGMDITVGFGSDGQLNKSDILIFMKDIGNSQRTNPVEVLYAAWPAILYLNASWAGYLLEPLLQFESSGLYNEGFAAEDLGNAFPSAIGNIDPAFSSTMESIDDMLIMTWAHASFSGDRSLLSSYYSTLKKWTNSLVSENPLFPDGFSSADGLNNANMTNLAIKGIIAIRSMAEISRVIGESDDYSYYSETASSLVSQWQHLAESSGHITSTYGAPSSWSLMYNLYPDKLLGFNLVDESIYSNQTSWYSNAASSGQTFGLPFDSNQDGTAKSHWTLFTAGTVTDSKTRDLLVSMVHAAASNQNNFVVFPTTYDTSNGESQGGAASPAQGAMYALLALNLEKKINSSSSPGGGGSSGVSSHSSKSKAGTIAGSVVGCFVFVALVAVGLLFYLRRRARRGIGLESDEKVPGSFAMFGSNARESNPLPQRLSNRHQIDPYPHYEGAELSSPTDTSSATRTQTSGLPRKYPLTINNHDNSTEETSVTLGTSDARPVDTAAQLREEVENLRRDMAEMRTMGQYEPPPEYQ